MPGVRVLSIAGPPLWRRNVERYCSGGEVTYGEGYHCGSRGPGVFLVDVTLHSPPPE